MTLCFRTKNYLSHTDSQGIAIHIRRFYNAFNLFPTVKLFVRHDNSLDLIV